MLLSPQTRSAYAMGYERAIYYFHGFLHHLFSRPLDPAALNRDSSLLPKGLAWLLHPRVRRARHLLATNWLPWRTRRTEPPGAPGRSRPRTTSHSANQAKQDDGWGWGHLLRLQLIPIRLWVRPSFLRTSLAFIGAHIDYATGDARIAVQVGENVSDHGIVPGVDGGRV
jgi:hypothetical protein